MCCLGAVGGEVALGLSEIRKGRWGHKGSKLGTGIPGKETVSEKSWCEKA